MARVTIEDCLDKVPNRFELTLLAANRARQISRGSTPMVPAENSKPSVLALREIAAGKCKPVVRPVRATLSERPAESPSSEPGSAD